MQFHDRAPLEKVRRLADGRVAAISKIARSGCYTYQGREIDPEGKHFAADQAVIVYRDPAEVFDEASLASFAHKALTLDHPADAVTAENWREHSVGYTEGKIARDGDFIEIPLMLADAAAVRAFDTGTRQLSAGYAAEIIFGDGVAPDGTAYQARQTKIRANHIALVAEGRAGPEARIGDSRMPAIARPGALPASATSMSDAKSGLATARRAWQDRKANQHRQPTETSSPEPRASDVRTGLADARNARLARLENAYRG